MNMSRVPKWAGVVSLAVCGIATAEAGSISVVRNLNYSGQNGAGEFGVTTFTDGPDLVEMGTGVGVTGNVFQTFCLEANEKISQGHAYDYTVDTDGAVNGGYSGGNPDPLSDETAYLYHQFLAGELTDYNYTLGQQRRASATALQLAIWELEGELGTTGLQNKYDNNAQAQAWVAEAHDAVADGGSWFGNGTGDVVVLNLTSNGRNAQSMLGELAEGGVLTAVPLPPAFSLGLGLLGSMSGLAVLRRRRRAQI